MYANFIEVDDLGSVGAGSVVEFIPKGKKLIPRPKNTTDRDYIFTHDVAGDSLYNPDDPRHSAFNGDTLICKAVISINEVTANKVFIIFIQTTCERLAKKIEIRGGYCYLISQNPVYPARRFPLESVEIKGVVVSMLRDW